MNPSTFHLPFLILPSSPTLSDFRSLQETVEHIVFTEPVISLLILNKNVFEGKYIFWKDRMQEIFFFFFGYATWDGTPAMEVWGPNHRATREFPRMSFFFFFADYLTLQGCLFKNYFCYTCIDSNDNLEQF